jgi:hypothetical protein
LEMAIGFGSPLGLVSDFECEFGSGIDSGMRYPLATAIGFDSQCDSASCFASWFGSAIGFECDSPLATAIGFACCSAIG